MGSKLGWRDLFTAGRWVRLKAQVPEVMGQRMEAAEAANPLEKVGNLIRAAEAGGATPTAEEMASLQGLEGLRDVLAGGIKGATPKEAAANVARAELALARVAQDLATWRARLDGTVEAATDEKL